VNPPGAAGRLTPASRRRHGPDAGVAPRNAVGPVPPWTAVQEVVREIPVQAVAAGASEEAITASLTDRTVRAGDLVDQVVVSAVVDPDRATAATGDVGRHGAKSALTRSRRSLGA
jgi:hypothetical protein